MLLLPRSEKQRAVLRHPVASRPSPRKAGAERVLESQRARIRRTPHDLKHRLAGRRGDVDALLVKVQVEFVVVRQSLVQTGNFAWTGRRPLQRVVH
jgi:hypothetical protein